MHGRAPGGTKKKNEKSKQPCFCSSPKRQALQGRRFRSSNSELAKRPQKRPSPASSHPSSHSKSFKPSCPQIKKSLFACYSTGCPYCGTPSRARLTHPELVRAIESSLTRSIQNTHSDCNGDQCRNCSCTRATWRRGSRL